MNRNVRTALPLALVALQAAAVSSAADFDVTQPPFTDPATLDPGLPAPAEVIGHEIGDDAVRYDAMVRYLHALDNASDLVTLTPYGQTHEGRTLYYLTITSRENHDRIDRRFSPQGAIASATLDEEHWLCSGLGAELPVLVAGSHVLMSMPPVQTPVRLKDEGSLRLAGLIWPEARHRLAHGAWATVERRGNGQVILFASDPFFRGQWEGTGRLLQNAILLGPGLGANPPLPW